MNREDLEYEYDPNGVNEVIDDLSANSFLALREVRWRDGDDYKLDLRRYFIKSDDTEMPGKGTSIMNPDKLTVALIEHGYGKSTDIINTMMDADYTDFTDSLGQACASLSDEEFETFQDNVASERSKAIIDGGINPDQFIEILK